MSKETIPFSKELWETGEYELITRGGEKDVKIYDLEFPDEDYPIVGRIGDRLLMWDYDGMSHSVVSSDLMLIKELLK